MKRRDSAKVELPDERPLNDEAVAQTNTSLCSLSDNGNALREMRQADEVGSVGASQSDIWADDSQLHLMRGHRELPDRYINRPYSDPYAN
jgi:hypothetical protein